MIVIVVLLVAVLLTLLIAAALEDVRTRRIPNALSLAVVLLFPLYVLASPVPVPWLWSVGLALGAFTLGFLLFHFAALGGGDVKLIAAAMLWAGPEHALVFVLITALGGGALALAVLIWRRMRASLLLPLALAGHHLLGGFWPGLAADLGERVTSQPSAHVTLPYGVAITLGGVYVAFQILGV